MRIQERKGRVYRRVCGSWRGRVGYKGGYVGPGEEG